jgi:hypothetical protein
LVCLRGWFRAAATPPHARSPWRSRLHMPFEPCPPHRSPGPVSHILALL